MLLASSLPCKVLDAIAYMFMCRTWAYTFQFFDNVTSFHYSVTPLILLSQPRVFYTWFLLIACDFKCFTFVSK